MTELSGAIGAFLGTTISAYMCVQTTTPGKKNEPMTIYRNALISFGIAFTAFGANAIATRSMIGGCLIAVGALCCVAAFLIDRRYCRVDEEARELKERFLRFGDYARAIIEKATKENLKIVVDSTSKEFARYEILGATTDNRRVNFPVDVDVIRALCVKGFLDKIDDVTNPINTGVQCSTINYRREVYITTRDAEKALKLTKN